MESTTELFKPLPPEDREYTINDYDYAAEYVKRTRPDEAQFVDLITEALDDDAISLQTARTYLDDVLGNITSSPTPPTE
jgi:hypothetical protein